jgi:hypothetical protein
MTALQRRQLIRIYLQTLLQELKCMMKPKSTEPTAAYAQEIARLIQCGKLPSLEQVQAAILLNPA